MKLPLGSSLSLQVILEDQPHMAVAPRLSVPPVPPGNAIDCAPTSSRPPAPSLRSRRSRLASLQQHRASWYDGARPNVIQHSMKELSASQSCLSTERLSGGRKLANLGQSVWRSLKRVSSQPRIEKATLSLQPDGSDYGSAINLQRRLATGQSTSSSSRAQRPSLQQLSASHDALYLAAADQQQRRVLRTIASPRDNPHTSRMAAVLELTVHEVRDVPDKKRYFCEILLDDVSVGRTGARLMKDNCCLWADSYTYDQFEQISHIHIRVIKIGKHHDQVHIGSVSIPTGDLNSAKSTEKWYALMPTGKNRLDDSAALRIRGLYFELNVLPMQCYVELLTALDHHSLSLCDSFESELKAKDKEDFARSLIRVLYQRRRDVEFLSDLIERQIHSTGSDSSLLLRHNSLASKSIESYLKLLGHDYLTATLQGFLQSLIDSGEDCEVDPSKQSDRTMILKNQHTLSLYTEVIWQKILKSTADFPRELRLVFSIMRQRLILSNRSADVDCVLSACVFLRYLCPAIMSPSLFNLVSDYPTEAANRTLTLIAKSIMALANFTTFGAKEPYMEFMNAFVERQWTNMKQFLHIISSPPSDFDLPDVRIKLDLARETALLHRELQGALVNLQKTQLQWLRGILTRIDQQGSKPGERLLISRPLSEYDNVMQQSQASPAPSHDTESITSSDSHTPQQKHSYSQHRPSQQVKRYHEHRLGSINSSPMTATVAHPAYRSASLHSTPLRFIDETSSATPSSPELHHSNTTLSSHTSTGGSGHSTPPDDPQPEKKNDKPLPVYHAKPISIRTEPTVQLRTRAPVAPRMQRPFSSYLPTSIDIHDNRVRIESYAAPRSMQASHASLRFKSEPEPGLNDVERKYMSEITLLKGQISGLQHRLNETEAKERSWRDRIDSQTDSTNQQDLMERVQNLERMLDEAQRKESIIMEQRKKISDLENVNTALMTYSMQLKQDLSKASSDSSSSLVTIATPAAVPVSAAPSVFPQSHNTFVELNGSVSNESNGPLSSLSGYSGSSDHSDNCLLGSDEHC